MSTCLWLDLTIICQYFRENSINLDLIIPPMSVIMSVISRKMTASLTRGWHFSTERIFWNACKPLTTYLTYLICIKTYALYAYCIICIINNAHYTYMHNISIAKATLWTLFTFWRDGKYEEISYLNMNYWTDTNLFLLT